MQTWFTSDTHFFHGNIIPYCHRPFKNADRMNEVLIKFWNQRVKRHDCVIFLGDFIFRTGEDKLEYILDRLNGQIVFVRGNHDNNNSLNTKIEDLVVRTARHRFYCCHRPNDYNDEFKINLVGHVHNFWRIQKRSDSYLINVGVDVWNYHPINVNEILKALRNFKKVEKCPKKSKRKRHKKQPQKKTQSNK